MKKEIQREKRRKKLVMKTIINVIRSGVRKREIEYRWMR